MPELDFFDSLSGDHRLTQTFDKSINPGKEAIEAISLFLTPKKALLIKYYGKSKTALYPRVSSDNYSWRGLSTIRNGMTWKRKHRAEKWILGLQWLKPTNQEQLAGLKRLFLSFNFSKKPLNVLILYLRIAKTYVGRSGPLLILVCELSLTFISLKILFNLCW